MNVEDVSQDVGDGAHEIVMKRLADWLAADDGSRSDLPESYANGEVGLHIHLGLRLGVGVSVARLSDHCALFQSASGMSAKLQRSPIWEALRTRNLDLDASPRQSHGGDRLVLVEVPQRIQDGERVFVRFVPSVVRLRPVEYCGVGGWDRPIHPRRVNDPLALGAADREARPTVGRSGPKSGDELVEGRPEAVNGVSDDDAPLDFRERQVLSDLYENLGALRVGLDYTGEPGPTVFLPPLLRRFLQSLEVFYSPLDFQAGSEDQLRDDHEATPSRSGWLR